MDLSYDIKDNRYFNVKEVLKEELLISDRLIKRLKNVSQIYLNNKPVDYRYSLLNIGDIISIDLNFEEESDNIVPSNIQLSILYEDDYMLVVNKPYNLPVHPSLNHYTDTLSNGVKYYFNSIGLNRKIRIVNRLDKDTSRNSYFCKK